MKAPITLAIDHLVSDPLAPHLKRQGFRKKGQRFWRDAGRCVQLVELDRGKYNEGSQGQLGITVGVFYPEIWAMVGQARPGWCEAFDDRFQPIQNCLVDQPVAPPVDAVSDTLESRWSVDADADLDAQGLALVQALDAVGLPWLESNAVLRNAVPRLLELSNKKVWTSSVYLLCAAVIERDRALATLALERVMALKTSRFYPESERQALRALAAPLGLA